VLCDGCSWHIDQMRRTIAFAGSLTEESITPQAEEGLLRAFRDWNCG